MRRFVWLPICLSFICVAAASATTIIVHQDGTGDFTTIADAVASASPGDLIRIGPGTYTDALTITQSLDLESESGAAVTILDGLGAHRIIYVPGSSTVNLRGLTLAHGQADAGSALLAWLQADVAMQDCIIADNYATGSNAVHVRHPGSSLHLQNCQFLRNHSAVHSGALSASMGANLYVQNCQFIENQAPGHGAVNAQDSHVEIEGCLFLRNAGGLVGALTLEFSNGFVVGNTFHANSGTSGSVRLADYTLFSKNIVTGNPTGYGLETVAGTFHTCNLYSDNHLGAADRPLGSGEIVEDPLYCDAGGDVYLVCSGSPALAGQGGCGAMGAYGMGCTCGPVSIESTTWGGLKSSFR